MSTMQRVLFLLLIFIFSANTAFSYELVLPREKKSISNTNYAFFVGYAKKAENITINNEKVYIASNGAFAHSVKLKEGENRIGIRSNYGIRFYKIYKNKPVTTVKPTLTEFDPKPYKVLKDETPLRSTPVDYGMNRMSHLFEGTNLIIDGEEGAFYRVYLSKDKYGWIDKNSVSEAAPSETPPKFITMSSETFKNASVHIIEFSDKIPYTIEESAKDIVFRAYNPQASGNSVYTVNIKKPEKYTYKTISSNGVYVFKVNELPYTENNTLEGLTIVVDAGHGGSEQGAIGCLKDKEKDINLKIALELKNILSLMGACVYLTRECDGYVSLNDRVKFARENCADIFVSVHLNSIPDIKMDVNKNRGTSVYYYNQNSKKLAKSVENSVTESLKTRKDGVRQASFAVIRPSDYVGILVENAYMTNPIDSVLYRSDDFAEKAAKGIANGILEYVSEDN